MLEAASSLMFLQHVCLPESTLMGWQLDLFPPAAQMHPTFYVQWCANAAILHSGLQFSRGACLICKCRFQDNERLAVWALLQLLLVHFEYVANPMDVSGHVCSVVLPPLCWSLCIPFQSRCDREVKLLPAHKRCRIHRRSCLFAFET